MLPLLLAYEFAETEPTRNVAEVALTLPLAPLGRGARLVREGLLGGLAIATAWSAYRSGVARSGKGLLPRVWHVVLEGGLSALLLGPTLLASMWLLGIEPGAVATESSRPDRAPSLSQAAFLAGGAAWEEILFRLGVQTLVLLLASQLLSFLTGSRAWARAGAEVLSIGAAGLLFSASHLAVFTQVLGPGGEAFDPAVFTWRLLAGILLGALFRWRGPGVSAWAHALFDLALLIGAGPDVFL